MSRFFPGVSLGEDAGDLELSLLNVYFWGNKVTLSHGVASAFFRTCKNPHDFGGVTMAKAKPEIQAEVKELSKSQIKKIYVTAKEAADFFAVAVSTFHNWSCPRIDKGCYDLKAVFSWWQDNLNKPVSDKDASSRERLSAAKAELAEIELAEKKAELLPKADFQREWATRAAELRQSLESSEFVLAPLLVGVESEDKAAEVINKFFRGVLESYCRSGRFTPVSKSEATEAPKSKGGKK